MSILCYTGLRSQLLCTIIIEFWQAQENKELKSPKIDPCAPGDPIQNKTKNEIR